MLPARREDPPPADLGIPLDLPQFEVAKLVVRPGDTLLVRMADANVGYGYVRRLLDFMQDLVGKDVRVAILPAGMDVSVLTPAEAAAEGV